MGTDDGPHCAAHLVVNCPACPPPRLSRGSPEHAAPLSLTARPAGGAEWARTGVWVLLIVVWLLAAAVLGDQPGDALAAVVALVLVGLAITPAAAAVLTEHPRRGVIMWLSAGALAGLVPLVVACWWMLLSRKGGGRAPGLTAEARWRRQLAAHPAWLGQAGLIDGAAVLTDLTDLVQPLVQHAADQCASVAAVRGLTVPAWLFDTWDDLEKALMVLRRLTGEGDDSRPGSRTT